MQTVRDVITPVLACLFDLGITVYIVGRMRRAMTSDAFWAAVCVEALSLTAGTIGMVIKGYGLTLMLVILGLAEASIILSTWGRVEVFFNVVAQPDTWYSRHATVVSLRFCAVALGLFFAAMPLLIALA